MLSRQVVPPQLQMEYSSLVPQYSAPSSVSSASGSCEGRASRLRTVRLARRTPDLVGRPPSFGFSLRGGREHGTGFFVSAVEVGSEAHCQGLRVGDQIVRLNGFPLEDAIHKEVLQLIQNHNFLTLKVRTVGMIPVKDKRSDPLTWRVIEEETPPVRPQLETSPVCQDDPLRDMRLLLTVPPRAKLGCGICKGPDWKPGIFVQFTKDNGIAKEVGLSPGDQILQCNGITFRDITFSDAVHVLKSSRQLDLVIRKCAGLDLFPGESSGYNSSASSLNGDQSPSWEDTKRLSVVKEESMELEERLGQLETSRAATLDKNREWEQIEYEWDKAERVADVRRVSNTLRSTSSTLKPSGTSCTIIRVEENGIGITNGESKDVSESGSRQEGSCAGPKLAEICMISQQQETTTVIVEVHRSEDDEAGEENDRSLHTASDSPVLHRISLASDENKSTNLAKSPSSSSFTSLASSAASSSLSSAISQELLRRSQKREEESSRGGDDCKKEIIKRINNEKKQQHEQLMEEFRRAHRKMFAHAVPAEVVSEDSSDGSVQDRESPDLGRLQKELPTPQQVPPDTVKERDRRPSKQQQETVNVERGKNNPSQPPPPPPPPPPMPVEDDSTHKTQLPLSNGNISPPSCPTPDYDTMSTRSSSSYSPTPSLAGGKSNSTSPNKSCRSDPADQCGENKVPDSVEMESLESFKLNNPAMPDPKPPSTYFSMVKARKDSQSSSSSSTPMSSKDSSLKRTSPKTRPVSVTIGEYPSGRTERRLPSKFDFLSASTADVSRACTNSTSTNAPITSQLQSELVQTLSRSNLRKRTEKQENHSSSTETSKGTVIIPVNSQPSVKTNNLSGAALPASTNGTASSQLNNITNKKPTVTTSTNNINCNVFQTLSDSKGHISSSAKPAIRDAAEKIANTFASNNRLTIKVANGIATNKQKETVTDVKINKSNTENTAQPNGILKNGTNLAWQNAKQPHATIVHQKSITFGKKTTIISDVAVSEN